jgi:hypothetical protein
MGRKSMTTLGSGRVPTYAVLAVKLGELSERMPQNRYLVNGMAKHRLRLQKQAMFSERS